MAIVCLMTIMMCFTSCNETSSKTTTFNIEETAKDCFTNICLKWAKCPDDFKLDNFETIYKSDSIVAITFITRGKNGFGGWHVAEKLGIYRIPTQCSVDSTNFDACYTIFDTEELYNAQYDDYRPNRYGLNTEGTSELWGKLKRGSVENKYLAFKILLGVGIDSNGNLNYGKLTSNEYFKTLEWYIEELVIK